MNRRRYPESLGGDIVHTSDRKRYQRTNVRNKIFNAGIGADGKPILIPYQTATLVRVKSKTEGENSETTD
jgi:hypothetical protein